MTESHRVRVSYRGARTMLITGPVTGAIYRFSGTSRWALLDPQDAVRLPDWQLFRVDGVVDLASTL